MSTREEQFDTWLRVESPLYTKVPNTNTGLMQPGIKNSYNSFSMPTRKQTRNHVCQLFIMYTSIAVLHVSMNDESITWERYLHYRSCLKGIRIPLVESPHKGKVMRSFDGFFVFSLNKLLNKHSICWWFETPFISAYVSSMLIWCIITWSMYVLRYQVVGQVITYRSLLGGGGGGLSTYACHRYLLLAPKSHI